MKGENAVTPLRAEAIATGAERLGHLLSVLERAAAALDEAGFDVDARIVRGHAAQLGRGEEWPGDSIAPATTLEEAL